jgi:hypothetical protein
LSATVINHTKRALTINHVTGGEPEDDDAPWLMVHGLRSEVAIEPEVPTSIGANTDITVHDAKIVVVPGQEKAYLGGWIESTIDDLTFGRPTATGPRGRIIEYLHQTATGGPSEVVAIAGKRTPLNQPPYLDDVVLGDADYVRASDVEVGQKITVTMRFPSGDVVTKFNVVQGRADGTV